MHRRGREKVLPLLGGPWGPMRFLDAGDPAEEQVTTQGGSLVLDRLRVDVDEPPDVPGGEGERGSIIGGKGERREGEKGAAVAELRPSSPRGGLRAVAADPEPTPGPKNRGGEGNSFAHKMTPERVSRPAPFLRVSALHAEVMRRAAKSNPQRSGARAAVGFAA